MSAEYQHFLAAGYLRWRQRLVVACLLLCSPPSFAQAAAEGSTPLPVFTEFKQVDGLYEPSAAEQMPDGRIFVVEDEIDHALAILSIQPDGSFSTERLDAESFFAPIMDKADPQIPEDFEGIAVDDNGYVYVITSHSREEDGVVYPRREQFIRFKLDGSEPTEMVAYGDLKGDIAAVHPVLAESAAVTDVKDSGGFNIEGIAFDKDNASLLVGFRSPQAGGKAVVVTINNPVAMFANGEKADVDDQLILLDLEGNGVRGIAYIPALDGYLLISGPSNRDRSITFKLWHWDGDAQSAPAPVAIPGPDDVLNRGECVSSIRWGDDERVLLIRDDGKKTKKKETYAHYMFLTHDQLSIKSP